MARPKAEPVQLTPAAIFGIYEAEAEDWRRDHLGASILGHACDRFLWLSFRWARDPKHPGRRLRLFERGRREEAWIIGDLLRIGCTVSGEQAHVRSGHVGGSLDGVLSGIPEAMETRHVLEVKTHNRRSFDRLVKDGVKRAKPEHYAQMQTYMRLHSPCIEWALYVSVCKDDDSIHTERVALDRKFADEALARAQEIVAATEPSPVLDHEHPPCRYVSADGTQWPCDYYQVCHGTEIPARSCRTCVSAEPHADGSWSCSHHAKTLDATAQRAACDQHLTIPRAINAQVVHVHDTARQITYQFASGGTFVDGIQV